MLLSWRLSALWLYQIADQYWCCLSSSSSAALDWTQDYQGARRLHGLHAIQNQQTVVSLTQFELLLMIHQRNYPQTSHVLIPHLHCVTDKSGGIHASEEESEIFWGFSDIIVKSQKDEKEKDKEKEEEKEKEKEKQKEKEKEKEKKENTFHDLAIMPIVTISKQDSKSWAAYSSASQCNSTELYISMQFEWIDIQTATPVGSGTIWTKLTKDWNIYLATGSLLWQRYQ